MAEWERCRNIMRSDGFREATILAIWEGTSHRQMLDGLEVMQRKSAHRLLFQHLAGKAPDAQLRETEARLEPLCRLEVSAGRGSQEMER
jgi:hypothetical protein